MANLLLTQRIDYIVNSIGLCQSSDM